MVLVKQECLYQTNLFKTINSTTQALQLDYMEDQQVTFMK